LEEDRIKTGRGTEAEGGVALKTGGISGHLALQGVQTAILLVSYMPVKNEKG
jgi:hypothetical protein